MDLLKDNGTNLSVYLDACSDAPPPLRSRGGLGWGASVASGKSLPLAHCFLLLEAIATFGCTLKPKQPHPSPTSQGREQVTASHGAMALKLVPLSLSVDFALVRMRFFPGLDPG